MVSAAIALGRFPSELGGVPAEDVFTVLASLKLDSEDMKRG